MYPLHDVTPPRRGHDAVNFTGTFTTTRTTGALNGSGFDNFAFTMNKQ